MAGDPAADRQALAAVPRAARAPAASWSTSPGCWRAPDPSWNATGSPTGARCTRGPVRPPPAADLYLLASVPHDWDDDHAARILAALGHSATGDTRLRIFEMLLPTDTTPHRVKLSDVLMLLLFDGPASGPLARTGTCWRAPAGDWSGSWPAPGRMSVIQASRSAPG
jgi:O-methyltransferase domain